MLLLLWPFFRCHSCRFRVADGAGNGEWELRAPLLVCGNVAAISVAAATVVAFCYALFTALMRDLGLAYTLNGGTVCVSNPLACNLSVSSSIRIGVCAELPLSLSLASFVHLISQCGSLKTHLNQRQHPLDSVLAF